MIKQSERETLKVLADRATPGPWDTDGFFRENKVYRRYPPSEVITRSKGLTRDNAAYIAAMHPGTCRAILREIDRLEILVKSLQDHRP